MHCFRYEWTQIFLTQIYRLRMLISNMSDFGGIIGFLKQNQQLQPSYKIKEINVQKFSDRPNQCSKLAIDAILLIIPYLLLITPYFVISVIVFRRFFPKIKHKSCFSSPDIYLVKEQSRPIFLSQMRIKQLFGFFLFKQTRKR